MRSKIMGEYKQRIVDKILDETMEVFNAVNVVGPKGCGKTTTCKRRAKTIVEFQDEDKREGLLDIANASPSLLLKNEKPILFDEWQDAPKIWGAIRKNCDDNPDDVGSFYLTGSSSKKVKTPHTGTLRISKVRMGPMSLYELGLSNGEASLSALFANPESFEGCKSDLDFEDIIDAICVGGWPRTLQQTATKNKLRIAKDLYRQTYEEDISHVDGKKRNPDWAQAILRSYARNICTSADIKKIHADVSASYPIAESTFYDYLNALKELFIIEDIDAWSPAIRSRSNIQSGKKRNLVDPSIAVAALGLSPEYFRGDFRTLGFLFESLCIRDLKVYSSEQNGTMSYYRDRYGLEADGVLHLEDGRYALIEFKMGDDRVEQGAKHLLEIERLIKEHNKRIGNVAEIRTPDLKIVIKATGYGYRLDNGVFVIPIGCLKD